MKRNIHFIAELCNSFDVVLLQETWLLENEIPLITNIHKDFHGTGTSAVDLSGGPLIGRPYGGTAILWRNSITCIPVFTNESRITGVKITEDNRELYLLTVYMPTCHADNLIDFTNCLSSLHSIITDNENSEALIMGDFNASPSSIFGTELAAFCTNNHYTCIDQQTLPLDSYTYVSDAHNTTSWLDHCVASESMKNKITELQIHYDITWTDHRAISCEIEVKKLCPLVSKRKSLDFARWNGDNKNNTNTYNVVVEGLLNKITHKKYIHGPCISSMGPCSNQEHIEAIRILYEDIVESVRNAACTAFTREHDRDKRKHIKDGWNNLVAEHYQRSREALRIWIEEGRPTEGWAADERRNLRKQFKKALIHSQRNTEQEAMDNIVNKAKNKQFKKFWTKSNELLKPKRNNVGRIDDSDNAKEIANKFRDIFCDISGIDTPKSYTSLPYDKDEVIVEESDVDFAMKSMKSGKSPGHDNLSIEHFKNAGVYPKKLLSKLFNLILSHNFLPENMTKTIITPIPKSSQLDLTTSSNYRPISLSTIIARLLEKVILQKIQNNLITNDSQMGFKSELTTDYAIYTAKQTIQRYLRNKTTTYACFLDLSKAFDKVDHKRLWEKLQKRNVPYSIINLLNIWHIKQTNFVKWNDEMSKAMYLRTGLRQGGCMSPVLFSVYMDELSQQLSSSRVGCHLGDVPANHVCYADDMVLLSPSVKGLRKLIKLCESYAEDHNMTYNAKKTEFMVFRWGGTEHNILPVKINGTTLTQAHKVKYLGHIIKSDLTDDDDIERQRRSISIISNMLARKFFKCSADVKKILFNAFCTNLYTCQLWTNYRLSTLNKLRVQYNDAYRIIFGYRRYSSASQMFAEGRTKDFRATMRQKIYGTRTKVMHHKNTLVQAAFDRQTPKLTDRWNRFILD